MFSNISLEITGTHTRENVQQLIGGLIGRVPQVNNVRVKTADGEARTTFDVKLRPSESFNLGCGLMEAHYKTHATHLEAENAALRSNIAELEQKLATVSAKPETKKPTRRKKVSADDGQHTTD